MPHVIDAPLPRGDLSDIAVKAAVSVPEDLSARRPSVRLMALGLVPACVAAPFLGEAAAPAMAAVIALAVVLRLIALAHVLGRPEPPRHAVPTRLPRVSILLPLRGEAKVVAELAEALGRLDYPADRLEVIVVVEEDDFATRTAIRARAPRGWQVIAVPRGHPRNKPRACNVGLAFATGEVVAIFDAEDRPEPDQVRKAVAALAADPAVAVAQARLGCDHAGAGKPLLGRLWGLEYAVLFGAIQPALARAGLPFLLGGTSNWFRAAALRAVGGWDAHNVTEDADLAVRLARAGWRSTVIDSTTWEEAPINLRQWVDQRSRWLMGFIVTTVVHFARPDRLGRELGITGSLAVAAQLPVGLACVATHPVGLWSVATGRPGDLLWVLAVSGYSIAIALHVVVARRRRTPLWLAAAMPVYWLLQVPALVLAVVDLARDPSHWRKTEHGLADRPEPASTLPGVAAARTPKKRVVGRRGAANTARPTPAARAGHSAPQVASD